MTISLTSVILTDIVGIQRLADAFGVNNFFAGVAAFAGPPLAGKSHCFKRSKQRRTDTCELLLKLFGIHKTKTIYMSYQHKAVICTGSKIHEKLQKAW